MPTLILNFPAGRYHATPWGSHVNEGLIEWPPSPWRLLRALLAAGYATQGWPDGDPPATDRSLIGKLAATLPRFHLPPAIGTHSRHYMPVGVLDKGRGVEKTTLVFDTWARVSGEMKIRWDVNLTADEEAALAALAAGLGYLGRSESWVEAKLAEPDGLFIPNTWLEEDPHPGPGWEQVALLAPVDGTEYAAWFKERIAQATADLDMPPPGKKITQAKQKAWDKAVAPYPADLIGCLQMQTSDLQGFGWSQPPGSRRVFYWRKSNALEVGAPLARPHPETPPVEAMLLALTAGTGNDAILPSILRTLPQGELLHRTLVGIAGKQSGHSRVLSGCDEEQRPLTTPHEHTHLLHLDLDGDGHLDHVLIWAPMGLDGPAQRAVRAARQTWTKRGKGSLRLALAGSGDLQSLDNLPGEFGNRLRVLLADGSGACRWISQTPFVPPRFLKKGGRNTLEGQVQAELLSRGHPAAASIRVLDLRDETLAPAWREQARRQRHFVRVRGRGPKPPADCGFTLELTFDQPVRGPICLGYGSHFGLGMFEAVP